VTADGFCPSCGGGRTGFLRFCRTCGLDFEDLTVQPSAPAAGAQWVAPPVEPPPLVAPLAADATTTHRVAPSVTRGHSKRRLAVFGVVALLGIGAIGNALDPATSSSTPNDTTAVATATPAPATQRPAVTAAPVPAFAPTGETEAATLLRVVDGDTVRVMLDGEDTPVRYIGIDTPEPDDADPAQRALAAAATAANAALLEGQDLILERDVSDTDTFGRILRYVWVEGEGGLTLVNLELVRLGLAQASSYPPDVAYDDVFAEAEEAARSQALGFWAAPPTSVPPPPATVTIVDTPVLITADARERFEGGRGSHTWSAVGFAGDRVTVRWLANASAESDCRVEWRLDPTGDSAIVNSTIRVSAGGEDTGNRRYDTPVDGAVLRVESTCARWAISMEGYETAPAATSAGGNCDRSYPDLCVPRYPPDLDCSWVYARGESHIAVRGADPHGFDGNDDGVGCESP
jgi:micrococcal nuclease